MTGNRLNFVETLELPDVWGAGPSGGIGAIHAGSGPDLLRRREQLVGFLPRVALLADGIIHNAGSLLFRSAP
jgi:hypothetical protein